MPPRLHEDPLQGEGPRKGAVVEKANFLKQRENYYLMSGWDPAAGNPTEVKLRELGLDCAWEAVTSKA